MRMINKPVKKVHDLENEIDWYFKSYTVDTLGGY